VQLSKDREELATALGAEGSVENLDKIVTSCEQRMTRTEARADIARRAETLCGGVEADQCPLCGTSVGWHALEAAIAKHVSAAADLTADMQAIEELRTRLETARRLNALIIKQEEESKK